MVLDKIAGILMRGSGYTWQEIGDKFEVKRQAAEQGVNRILSGENPPAFILSGDVFWRVQVGDEQRWLKVIDESPPPKVIAVVRRPSPRISNTSSC